MREPTAPILRVHPLSGAAIRPLGRRRDGRLIWPILGGDESAGSGGDGGGGSGGTSTGTGGEGGKPPEGGGKPPEGGGKVDLTQLSVDDLRSHPEFQGEINRVVTERVKREQAKWQQQLEEERKRAQLPDAEKATADLEAARKQAQESAERVTAAYQKVAQTRAQVLAIEAGGRADRAAAIVGQADLTGAVDDDGNVSDAVVKAAVTKVLGDYPEWKADAKKPPAGRSGGELTGGQGGDGPTFTQSQVEAMSTEERVAKWDQIEKAMAEGRFVYGQ